MSEVLFNRSYSLILAGNAGNAIDLSQLHFNFTVRQSDIETPNSARIRVYNLNIKTISSVLSEFTSVILQVGYGGNLGIIFQGTIVQFFTGRERNVDNYIDIVAADGDGSYNFGFMNQTLAPGSSLQDQLQAQSQAMDVTLDASATAAVPAVIQPRGKVMFGLARLFTRDLAATSQARWSLQDGKLTLIPLTGYLPSDVVEINSLTGMVGVPEVTDNGISLRTLMSSKFKIGTRVRLNNNDVTQTEVKDILLFTLLSQQFLSKASGDGTYRVLVVEHTGDTRGTEWYSDLTCLAIVNPNAPATAGAVLAAG